MKNSQETLEQGKFYTTRMSSCIERQFDFEGYIISIKGQPKYFEPARCFNPEKEKKFFVYGKGWQKITPNNIIGRDHIGKMGKIAAWDTGHKFC